MRIRHSSQESRQEYLSSFQTFKCNICHRVKDMGDENFMIDILEKDEIRALYNKRWFPESLYLLAMLDYLSRENNFFGSLLINGKRSSFIRGDDGTAS